MNQKPLLTTRVTRKDSRMATTAPPRPSAHPPISIEHALDQITDPDRLRALAMQFRDAMFGQHEMATHMLQIADCQQCSRPPWRRRVRLRPVQSVASTVRGRAQRHLTSDAKEYPMPPTATSPAPTLAELRNAVEVLTRAWAPPPPAAPARDNDPDNPGSNNYDPEASAALQLRPHLRLPILPAPRARPEEGLLAARMPPTHPVQDHTLVHAPRRRAPRCRPRRPERRRPRPRGPGRLPTDPPADDRMRHRACPATHRRRPGTPLGLPARQPAGGQQHVLPGS